MAVSKRLRFEVLRRDSHTCRYCGRSAPEVKLTVDHVVPETLGGSDDPDNLVAACSDCNAGKSSVPADAPLVNDVAVDAARWSRAMQEVAETRRSQREEARRRQEAFIAKWNTWTYQNDKPVDLSAAWRSSIDQFITAGLEVDELTELVDVAMEARVRDTWRYFCGCCWRRITQNQEAARSLITYEENAQRLLEIIQGRELG